MQSSETVRPLIAALLICLAASAVSSHQPARVNKAGSETAHRSSISSPDVGGADLEVFIAALRKAVAADDRHKVASMIRYPIVIFAGGRSVLFNTPASLLRSYNLIFTPYLRKLIAEVQPDPPSGKGAMIHNGEIWINEVAPGRLKIITIQHQTGNDREQEKPAKLFKPGFKVHPKLFSMIDCSESDFPVVTEINLDAVAQDDNEFQQSIVEQDGEWISYKNEDGEFTGYRVLKTEGDRYTVEYVANGNGTLQTAAIIEFVVHRRQVRKDGKLKSIRVLRVLAYAAQ